MITFLLDARFARAGALDGLGRYVWNVARHLPAALGADERLAVLCMDDDLPAYRAALPGALVRGTDVPIASAAQHRAWPVIVSELRPDVVHYPQLDLPPVPRGVAAVATFTDFTPLEVPDYFGRGRGWRAVVASGLYASTAARADVVTTLSRTIAREALARFPRLAGRVVVTPPGPSLAHHVDPAVRARGVFVYVGNHRPHKRVPFLLGAFARARERLPELQLLLLGRSDPRFPEVGSLLRGRLGAGVQLIEGPSDADIAAQVARARALVVPSVGEGYGFPVTEAFGVGTPAVVADAGSLPEVLDGGGLVVAADDVDAWAEALGRLATDDELWSRVAARAAAVVAGLSWRSTAESVLGSWRQALARRRENV